MLNRIVLVGRLTADPELRYSNANKAVCHFRLAVDGGYGENKRTDFINIVAFNKTAELSAECLRKGKMAAVDGRLQIRQYEKDGEKRSATEVVADNVRFLSPKGETESGPWAESDNDDVIF